MLENLNVKSVIFLDHDGVMCLAPEWGTRAKKRAAWYKKHKSEIPEPPEVRFDNFNRKAVEVLNRIIEKTDTEIVISSDWRLYCTLEEMQDFYRKYGVIKTPIDFTPVLKSQHYESQHGVTRVQEIKSWLNLYSPPKWVAVDDIFMGKELRNRFGLVVFSYSEEESLSNFVHTRFPNEGIKQTGIEEKILTYL